MPHRHQEDFINSRAKRKIIRAGRRAGKTVGIAIHAVRRFMAGARVLYGTPTQEQIDRFWTEVRIILGDALDKGIFTKNETRHLIEKPGTESRIRAKTAWNADTMRGDYADELILDEFQLMNEDTWEVVGAPMMLDTNGNATFIYTPPSIRSAHLSRARDPMHAAKLWKKAQADDTGRWETFHFTSLDNPYLSTEALKEITFDMTGFVYEQEILAEDKEENPRSYWTREMIEGLRVTRHPELRRVVVAIDPSATKGGDEAGIVVAGVGTCLCKGEPEEHGFVLEDASTQASPEKWATEAVAAYHRHGADRMVAESNNGGEMVAVTIKTVPGAPSVKLIHASRGKAVRAEPIAAYYEKGNVHHVGNTFGLLENEMCYWSPDQTRSPNRMDALVWGLTELMTGGGWSYAA